MHYKATIVVPVLRQPDDWLEQSVRSAVTQDAPTEVVVVTSLHTPVSNLRVLDRLRESYANLVVVREKDPGSFPGALNEGIRTARAGRIGFLLSDDWLEKDAVSESMKETADIVSSGNTVHWADGRVNEAASKNASFAEFCACTNLEKKASYLEHFFLFRRGCLIQAGGLDESIGDCPGLDDYDLIWTLLERGATVAVVEKRLYHYRDHELERLTLHEPEEMVRTLMRILQKHGVGGWDAQMIMARHARWYGKPIYEVMPDSASRACQRCEDSCLPEPVSKEIIEGDVSLTAIMEYACSRKLKRIVVDGPGAAEYDVELSAQVAKYRRTGTIVTTRIDSRGRRRIKIPFRFFGHVASTRPVAAASIAWCLDLLKSGCLIVHLPTPFGARELSVPAQLIMNCLRRAWRPRRLEMRVYSSGTRSALCRAIRHRRIGYRPEPKRILMTTSTLNLGGSERQMAATAAGLLKGGYDVRIVTFGSSLPNTPSVEGELAKIGIQPRLLSEFAGSAEGGFRPVADSALGELAGLTPWFLEKAGPLAAAIRHFRPAVVHGWLDVPAVISAVVACALGVTRVVLGQRTVPTAAKTERYPPEVVRLLREGYRAVACSQNAVILNNSAVGALEYERWLGLQPATIRVLRNGFLPSTVRTPTPQETMEFRESLGLPRQVPVVGSVMRFDELKDPLLWLDTAAEIAKADPSIRFLLAGYGPLRREIAARVAVLGLGDRIVLPGAVTDIGLLFSTVDLVLLTSVMEGVPNVLIEAQAAGRLVVAPDVGGTREAVFDPWTGRLVGERSAKCLAEAVTTILSDPNCAARARTEGPKFVSRRFDFERMIRETLDIYGMGGGVNEGIEAN